MGEPVELHPRRYTSQVCHCCVQFATYRLRTTGVEHLDRPPKLRRHRVPGQPATVTGVPPGLVAGNRRANIAELDSHLPSSASRCNLVRPRRIRAYGESRPPGAPRIARRLPRTCRWPIAKRRPTTLAVRGDRAHTRQLGRAHHGRVPAVRRAPDRLPRRFWNRRGPALPTCRSSAPAICLEMGSRWLARRGRGEDAPAGAGCKREAVQGRGRSGRSRAGSHLQEVSGTLVSWPPGGRPIGGDRPGRLIRADGGG